jgi:hypothetical protein
MSVCGLLEGVSVLRRTGAIPLGIIGANFASIPAQSGEHGSTQAPTGPVG